MFKNDKEELTFYRKLHNQMYASIYIINLEQNSIEWITDNKIVDQVLGMNQQEVIDNGETMFGRLFKTLDFSESVEQGIEEFINNPDATWSGVYRIRHNDGSVRWVIYTTSTFETNSEGKATKTVCVAFDPSNLLSTPLTLEYFLEHVKKAKYKSIKDSLTPRQQSVVEGLFENKTDLEIASKLKISIHTVRDHKAAIFKKLEVKNLKELFAAIEKYGLIIN